jgi:hypothetical protein
MGSLLIADELPTLDPVSRLIDVLKPKLARPQVVLFHFDGDPASAEFFGDHAEGVGARK